MKQYKHVTLSVNKSKKEGDNLPNFAMSVMDTNQDGKTIFTAIGGGWKKLDKNGQSYMSLSLANAYDKNTKERLTYTNKNGDVIPKDGYCIVSEPELRELMKKVTLATGEAFNDNLIF